MTDLLVACVARALAVATASALRGMSLACMVVSLQAQHKSVAKQLACKVGNLASLAPCGVQDLESNRAAAF